MPRDINLVEYDCSVQEHLMGGNLTPKGGHYISLDGTGQPLERKAVT